MVAAVVTNQYGMYTQSFPPTSKFLESDVPDLTGKVCIVTGSNVGIGYETARVLLVKNAKVYMACRSAEKASKAIESLKELTGKEALFLQLDLGNIKSAKASAKEFMTKETELHILFNNAGVMVPPVGSKTSDGFELQWGTNCLGHYIFTETLLPLLKSTASSSPAGTVRIITTASSAHTLAPKGGINLVDQFAGSNWGNYGQSKLGNVIMSQYWSEKLKGDGIICLSLNPGNIKSDLQRTMQGAARMFLNLFLHPVSKGALTPLYAGTSQDITMKETGAYLVPWARIDVPAREEARDGIFCEKVMDLMKSQCEGVLAV